MTSYKQVTEHETFLDTEQIFKINKRNYLKKGRIDYNLFWIFVCSEFPINFQESNYFCNQDFALSHGSLPQNFDFMTLYMFNECDLGYTVTQV